MNDTVNNSEPVQIELTVSAWGSPAAQLASASELSEAQVIDAANKGAVWRRPSRSHRLRRIRDVQHGIEIEDQLYLNYDARVLAQKALQPRLVSDQLNYSIWNKPAGMLSQGSKWSDHCTITETVALLHKKPTYLVHRLDKAASGLIVVAHTKNALKKLTKLFELREIEKYYSVLVHGELKAELPLRIDTRIAQQAALSMVLAADYDAAADTSTLRVQISTGRKHQIRHHMHSIGLPVVGDRLYDADRTHKKDLQLTASELAFVCPFTHKKQRFTLT